MATKVKSHPLNGVHTAGIFADMSVDGPEIGTLVAIVDRAKNLPNRKTIGKQDPYCAARLGKEAKKTTTDIRGGQTPKWDQELRFTVHDSPDYYQLKISVFTDDKKTDLIGESWIDLRQIIIPGGGQNDVWQTLSCRGKYAGEIRIEITYYDTRPKPEKPAAVKSKQASSTEKEYGSIKQKSPVKRRPLPIDPVTGEAPPAPSPEHQTPPPRAHSKQPSHSSFVPNQSPLQAVEYNTPPAPSPRNHHPERHSPSPHTGPPQGYVTPTRGEPAARGPRPSMDAYEAPAGRYIEEREYSPSHPTHAHELADSRAGHYSPLPEAYEPAPLENQRQYPPVENDHPPPPPVHRTRHNSGSSQELVPRNAYDTSPTKASQAMQMRHDVLRNEAHRHSMPVNAYPGRPTFRGYDSAPSATQPLQLPPSMSHESGSPRHHSYDQSYDPHHRSMQPTVEDAPESPAQYPNTFRHSGSRAAYQEDRYEQDPSPAPLNLSRSPGGTPYRQEQTHSYDQQGYRDQNGYRDNSGFQGRNAPDTRYQDQDVHQSEHRDPGTYSVSPLSNRGPSHSPGHSYHSRSGQSQNSGSRAELETTHIQSSPNYALPALPPSLVPGLDPKLSQEITEQLYEDRRQSQRHNNSNTQMAVTPTRGRQRVDSYQSYNPASGSSPGYAPQSYDRRAITYGNTQETQLVKHRDASPNPRTSPNPQSSAIRRKSVSPAPPPTEARRLSAVPFGPDSYNELNPSLVSSKDGTPPPDYDDAKIITHDGREIDPSDHLPMESWAPEPENKKQPSPDLRGRTSLSGAQPMPSSTRRTPRSGRPHAQSMSASPQPYRALEDPHTPPAPSSTGRTRLQKRVNRASAGPSPAASSPLAPISPDNYQERQSPYTPTRGLPRASTWDHQNENRAPYGSGPPVPAKIPLPLMSGANGHGEELALMEEMQRIDIGTGRSRRRGGY